MRMIASAAVASTNWPSSETFSRYSRTARMPMSSELLGITGAVDKPAGCLGNRVQHSWFVLGWPPLPTLADPAVDQPWVDLMELAIANAPLVPLTGWCVLDDHVGMDGKILENLPAFFRLQVQSHGGFVAHLVEELSANFLSRFLVLEHV